MSWSNSECVTSEVLIEVEGVSISIWVSIMMINIEFWTFSLSKSWSVDDINDWFVLTTWIVIVEVIAISSWIHVVVILVEFWAFSAFLGVSWSYS